MLNQESVVSEIRINQVILHIGDIIHQNIVIRWREQNIRRNGHHETLCPDSSKHLFNRATASSQIVRIYGLRKTVVGVGIESAA